MVLVQARYETGLLDFSGRVSPVTSSHVIAGGGLSSARCKDADWLKLLKSVGRIWERTTFLVDIFWDVT